MPSSGRKGKSKVSAHQEIVSLQHPIGVLVETTFDPARQPLLQFAVWTGKDFKAMTTMPLINGATAVPPADRNGLIEKRVVLLPSTATEYGSPDILLAELVAFIHRYADVPDFWEELIAHYVLMTWVYDRFTAVPYLRFLGEPQSGKTRCLQVAGSLSYKAIFGGGSTTASPLFRLLDLYRGTFVLDEADYKSSDLWSEMIKILNCGYMRGMPVLRSDKKGDSYDPRAFDVFGPKILSTRKEFEDHALETRCITLRTGERKIRPDIPRQLPEAFNTEALELRNKLLRWRFENHAPIQSDESKLLDLEPRLTQIGAPIYTVSCDPGFRVRLLTFLGDQADQQRGERPQAMVAEAIRICLQYNTKWPATLTVKEVSGYAHQVSVDWDAETNFTPKRTAPLVRTLGFDTRRTGTGYQFDVTAAQLSELVSRYKPKTGAATTP